MIKHKEIFFTLALVKKSWNNHVRLWMICGPKEVQNETQNVIGKRFRLLLQENSMLHHASENKQSHTHSGWSYLFVIRLYSNRLSCWQCPAERVSTAHILCLAVEVTTCSVLIIQFSKAQERVTDRFGRSLVQLDAGGTVQGGWQNPGTNWRKMVKLTAAVCVCVWYIQYVWMTLYVTACAHEHSVTLQPAQMSHVWLHSRETVRGLCAPLSVCERRAAWWLHTSGATATAVRWRDYSGQLHWKSRRRRRRRRSLSCKRSLWQQQASEIPLPYSLIHHSLVCDCCSIQMNFFSAHIDRFAAVMNKRSGLIKCL